MRHRSRIRTTATGAGLLATLVLAGPAAAHVEISPEKAPSDAFALLSFQVPHGCNGSPTTSLSVQVPDDVPMATPQVHPGWDLLTRNGAKQPVTVEGEKVASGVSEITWTAAAAGPLPQGRLDLFTVSAKLPAGKAGDPVYFPAVQKCVKGETRWIELPKPGQDEEDLESPAPSVTLTAADDESGQHGAATENASATAATAAAADDDSGDGPSTGLVIAALVLGGLGLIVGLVALVRGDRGSTET